MSTPEESPPKPRTPGQVVAALCVTYLAALQQSPGLPEEQYQAAEELKQRLATEL